MITEIQLKTAKLERVLWLLNDLENPATSQAIRNNFRKFLLDEMEDLVADIQEHYAQEEKDVS